ncbi:MAG: sensor histidine kinase [Methyloligellaceae bacterium]
MKQLYQKIYLTVIGSLIALVIIAGLCWKLLSNPSHFEDSLHIAREIATTILPPAADKPEDQQKKLGDLADRFRLELALFDASGKLIAITADGLPAPSLESWRGERTFQHRRGAWIARLADGRWVSVRRPPPDGIGFGPFRFIFILGGIVLAIAIAIYPAVRGLTGRLERLQQGVETLGSGDLATRVSVEGRDEIAQLATSFNTAAERIEALLNSHKMFLANASHELRTPLSRLRVTVELLKDKADPKHRSNLETDIAELDDMIEEILLASRLNTLNDIGHLEEVDLLALAAEETARYPGFELEGEQVTMMGDSRLLRRMIRNLLENAKRYGTPPVNITLHKSEGNINLQVADKGKNVASENFEKIFDPFFRPEGTTGTSGTGLGLALVRQIARRHGGEATVKHLEGGCTCFEISLPGQKV